MGPDELVPVETVRWSRPLKDQKKLHVNTLMNVIINTTNMHVGFDKQYNWFQNFNNVTYNTCI